MFDRLELLVGQDSLSALAGARVILFGVGGVGSWCAEALTRSGIGHLTIVDSDVVCATNINRQLPATTATIGEPKVDVMVRRLREINPAAEIIGIQRVYNRDTKDTFGLDGYDYVIDAIDSLSSKVDLIMNASARGATVFSALGAACKVDPTRVRVSSIWKSDKCRLGRFVRKRLRRWGFKGDFLCVWSDENEYNADSVYRGASQCGTYLSRRKPPCLLSRKAMRNLFISAQANAELKQNAKYINVGANCVRPSVSDNDDIRPSVSDNNDNRPPASVPDNDDANQQPSNKTINGSLVCVTGVFGFTLSSLVIRDIIDKTTREVAN